LIYYNIFINKNKVFLFYKNVKKIKNWFIIFKLLKLIKLNYKIF